MVSDIFCGAAALFVELMLTAKEAKKEDAGEGRKIKRQYTAPM
ncbi:hypothetical protein [Deinococcus xinjiangensis]